MNLFHGPSITNRRIQLEGGKTPAKQNAVPYGYGPGQVPHPPGSDAPAPEGTPYDVAVMQPPMTAPGLAPDESVHRYARPLVD